MWDDDYPSNNLAANQIHTYIQSVKGDIMERLRAYDGNNYEHIVFDSSATGRHLISSVGFVKILSDAIAVQEWIDDNHPGNGSVITDGLSLFISNTQEAVLSSSLDHGNFNNLDKADHPQYMDTLGERAATGNWELTGETQLNTDTFGTDPSDALPATHAGLSWYDAHGANSIWKRHLADGSVGESTIKYVVTSKSLSAKSLYVMDSTVNRWTFFPSSSGHSIGSLTAYHNGIGPIFSWSVNLLSLSISFSTVDNGVSI